jgi:hypothetical protein
MEEALRDMQELKMIRKKSKEDREIPNRNFAFSSEYDAFHSAQEKLETVPYWDIAEAVASILEGERAATMYRTNGDEEVAACLTLLSQDHVDTSVDLSGMEKIKLDPLFNAKKVHDDQLELPVHFHFHGVEKIELGKMERWTAESLMGRPKREAALHWAAATESSGSADDLTQRTEKAWQKWINKLKSDQKREARQLKAMLDDAGPDGVTKQDLLLSPDPFKHLSSLIVGGVLTAKPLPLAFHTGYDEGRLVSARFVDKWTVDTSSHGQRKAEAVIFPHKWFDIFGNFNRSLWQDSMRLLVHAVLTRPGISRFQVLVQFQLVMDRVEVCRLIDVACQANVMEKALSSDQTVRGEAAEWKAADDRGIALFVSIQ